MDPKYLSTLATIIRRPPRNHLPVERLLPEAANRNSIHLEREGVFGIVYLVQMNLPAGKIYMSAGECAILL